MSDMNSHTKVIVDSLPDCDICKHLKSRTLPGEAAKAKYDGKTNIGPFAYMCQECFEEHGVGLGLGKGQELVTKLKEE